MRVATVAASFEQEELKLVRSRVAALEREKAALLAALQQGSGARASEALGMLSEASAILASSLDYETTLLEVCRRLIPDWADGCAIYLFDDDGALEQVAAMHVEPARVADLRALYALQAKSSEGRPLFEVARKGEVIYQPEVDPEKSLVAARSEEERELLARLSFSSVLGVPLWVHRRCSGVLTLFTIGGRKLRPEELSLARELAYRVAMAVDNARLFRLAREGRAAAEQASQAKDELLAAVSHELRTPLTATFGWLRLLRASSSDPRRREKAIRGLERNVREQARQVEALLGLSALLVGRAQLDLQAVRLDELVDDGIEALRADAKAKQVAVRATREGTDLAWVWGDSARLAEAVWALLANAVKFTPAGGEVSCLLRCGGGQVELEVRDTGVGIPLEFLPRLFSPFEQRRRGQSSRSGLGVGLALVRCIAELHGGTVEGASEGEGLGATFRLRLPSMRKPPATAKPSGAPKRERSTSGRKRVSRPRGR